MSLFSTIQLPCPACEKRVAFEAVTSVNADRRPDLRDAILNGTFQAQECPACGAPFRLDPAFTYVDTARGQWIQAQAFGDIGQWETLEAAARKSFRLSYGPGASDFARELGETMKPRIVFGWAALSEKIVAREAGLNDATLELAKMLTFSEGGLQLDRNADLRLAAMREDQLEFAWINAESGRMETSFSMPASVLKEIEADEASWKNLRSEFADALFVDLQRLMLPKA